MNTISFRPVNPNQEEDLRIAADMRAATYAASGRTKENFSKRWSTLEDYRAYLFNRFTSDPRYAAFVTNGAQIVGHIIGDAHNSVDHCGYVEILYIDPEHRGQRLGEKALHYLEGVFREKAMTHSRTVSHLDAPALTTFYASCGYRNLGLADDKLPALILWEKTFDA